MAWLPGLDPARVGEAMESVQRSPAAVRQVEGVTGLAKANLLAAALARLQAPRPAGELPVDIVELSVLLELCDPEQLRAQINEERAVAGFPEVRETSLVAEALADRRRHYRSALKNALEVLSPLELVSTVTAVVTEVTARGTRPAPALIDDLVARVASRPRNARAADLSSRRSWAAKSVRGMTRPRSSMTASPRGSAATEKGSPTKLRSRGERARRPSRRLRPVAACRGPARPRPGPLSRQGAAPRHRPPARRGGPACQRLPWG